MSHPSWVRGLKQKSFPHRGTGSGVAPLVGAWIETDDDALKYIKRESHPSWVRGLKPVNL